MRRLKILTWHVHGSYLYYLSHCPHDFYLPVDDERGPGYCGRTPSYDWPPNVHEVPVEMLRKTSFDCVLFQSHRNFFSDQHLVLSAEQKKLPRIFLEHDPPREHPTDTFHPVDDPEVLLVHVTAFNRLMWNCRRTPATVIDHGVVVPDDVHYSGRNGRGIVVVNNIMHRGRRLGADIYAEARSRVPLDLVGMGWEEAGGLGEIPHQELPGFESKYRFFFNPIRYTSLPLSLCEAMMVGMPVVALATTELTTLIENWRSGYIDTRPENLIAAMRILIAEPGLAKELSEGAKKAAQERFGIRRFVEDWNRAFSQVTGAPL